MGVMKNNFLVNVDKSRTGLARVNDEQARPVYAAIDLGTTSCRLVIASPTPTSFQVIETFSKVTRLGEGIINNNELSRQAIRRTLTALKICAGVINEYAPIHQMRLVATAACRRAKNCGDFLTLVKKETGLNIEIISSKEEARLAVVGCIPLLNRCIKRTLVFDIGGGSTEISLARITNSGKTFIEGFVSLPYGVVTISEAFPAKDMTDLAYNSIIERTHKILKEFDDKYHIFEAIKNQDAAAIKQIQEIGNAVKDGSAQSEIDADSWAWGWNIGVMWSPVQNFRVGLSYRSEITHDADGDLKVNGLQGVVPGNWQESALGSIISGAISQSLGTMDGAATVSAPAWAMASVAWDVNDLLSLYASFRWTDWSSFDKLDIEGNGTTMATVTNKWRDTYLGSLGADLRLTDWWTLRGGIAYESSPISDPSYRTAIIPDADRWWFAIGSSFKLTDQLIWDVSFAHLHGVHERNLYAAEGSNEKVGRFRKLDAYLLGTQLQYRF